jgi:hypothetical protein
MKKFCLLVILGLLIQPVFAETIPVQALGNFSTAKPSSTYSVKVLKEFQLNSSITINEGDIVHGKIVDVVSPKRLKRDATFTFVPNKVTTENGHTTTIKGEFPARYTVPIDKKALARTAALGVGSYFVKGLALGVNAVEGAIKNEEDNRLVSSIDYVYENSPLSYVEKGEDIEIKYGEEFFLNFPTYQEEIQDEPNYEYTELGN